MLRLTTNVSFQQATRQLNWANAASSNGPGSASHTKSLAEIQAEEERQERERQERERKEKKARQKEMGLAQVSQSTSLTYLHQIQYAVEIKDGSSL
jgi:hypothetical protein